MCVCARARVCVCERERERQREREREREKQLNNKKLIKDFHTVQYMKKLSDQGQGQGVYEWLIVSSMGAISQLSNMLGF